MNEYTESASRPGKTPLGTDDRELFLIEFGGMVIEAYMEALDYNELRFVKQITQGKADTFPIIGRKRDATDHTPGDRILGGTIEHDEIEINLDKMLIDSAFIPEIDQLMAHYNLSRPYSTQLGQSLGTTQSKRIAIMHILASRGGVTGPGQPTPAYYYHANLRTDASKLEEAAFLSKQYLLENDMSGQSPEFMLPWQQVLLMARYSGIEGGPVTTGSGNRASGTVGPVAGFVPKGTNHIPNTDLSAVGPTKYRGNFSTTVGHVSSKMAVGSLERRGMKVVMKEQDDRLGTILIASMFNGHGKLRNECSIELRTDAIGGRDSLTD